MHLTPYLSFDGNCAEAFAFYETALEGKIGFSMKYGEAPEPGQIPPGMADRTMHISLTAEGATLSGADSFVGQYQKPQGITVALSLSDSGKAERIFKALAEGGEVQMPLTETFWAKRFGMCVDRYGVPWMINCEKPMNQA